MARSDARVLILGSMPGVASLKAEQYYAHPRNAFWRLMEELIGVPCNSAYASRSQALMDAHVAVWDVLQSCVRPGSLDSEIKSATEVPNDFLVFLENHPDLRAIFFNGRKAEQVFARKVLPTLPHQSSAASKLLAEMPLIVLPSTSPAMAALDFAGKLQRWQHVAEYLSA